MGPTVYTDSLKYLELAGLVTHHDGYNTYGYKRHYLIVKRARLESLVAEGIKESILKAVIAATARDTESAVDDCPFQWVHDTKTRLYALAKAKGLRITIEREKPNRDAQPDDPITLNVTLGGPGPTDGENDQVKPIEKKDHAFLDALDPPPATTKAVPLQTVNGDDEIVKETEVEDEDWVNSRDLAQRAYQLMGHKVKSDKTINVAAEHIYPLVQADGEEVVKRVVIWVLSIEREGWRSHMLAGNDHCPCEMIAENYDGIKEQAEESGALSPKSRKKGLQERGLRKRTSLR